MWHTCERIMARHRQVWKGLVGHSIPSMEASGSVWIGLILLKLKIYCWNHCSKIIFKCVNSTRGPIFNEKVAKKWNLWVHKQYIMHCLRRKVNICGYCSLNSTWTVTAFCQNAWKKKKKKTQNADVGGKRGSKHTLSYLSHLITIQYNHIVEFIDL